MEAIFDKRFSQLALDGSCILLVVVFLSEVRERVGNFHQHILYIHAILGCGMGASIALLGLLTIAELCSCSILVIPPFFKRMGPAVPSIALGTTMTVEAILYHGFGDNEILVRFVMLTLGLCSVALFRGDKKARTQAIGVPLQGKALAIESFIRKACSRSHAAIMAPPLCGVLFIQSLLQHCFWAHTGANYEIKRNSFLLNVSICSVLLQLAGHDHSSTHRVWERFCEATSLLYRMCERKFSHSSKGMKKRL